MGVLARLAGVETRGFSLAENPARDPALAALFGYNPSTAGISVTERTALNYSAVWQAVQVIAGDLASVPLPLYRRRADGGRERATAHPLYRLLRNPNPEMSSMAFRNTVQAHVLTWGNGFAEIERNGSGRPVALWPIEPDRVTVARDSADALVYRVSRTLGPAEELSSEEVFHVPGLAYNGLVGYSPVRMLKEAIGLGMATEKFGAAFFGNGAWAGVVLEYPEVLKTEQYNRLKESWNEQHQGPTKAHGITILENGMKASKPLTIPPDDAQFLQTRIFQVVEVARAFNIAVWKLRDMENQHYNNIEHEKISHVTDTLRPWAVRWEQEIERKLLLGSEREDFYAEHLFDALLRGDLKSRYDAHAVGRQWGWRSVNEVKELENENPIGPEGDVYLVPTNMMAADRLNDPPPPPPAPVNATEPVPAPPEPEQRRARVVREVSEMGRREVVIAAARGVLVDTVGRMVRKEAAAARRAIGKDLEGWAATFYPKHKKDLATAITPAIRLHLSLCDGSGDPGVIAGAIASDHVARSLQELSEPGEARDLESIVTRWEIERPERLADQVMSGGME